MSKKEAVMSALRDLIREDAWRNGDRLPSERALAESFGVGRNTLREAIYTLEAQGIVEVKPGSGCFLVAKELLGPGAKDDPNDASDPDILVFEALFQILSCITSWCTTIHGQALVGRVEQATSMMGAAFLSHDPETVGLRYQAYLKLLAHWTGNSLTERMVDLLCNEGVDVFRRFSDFTTEQSEAIFADMARLVQAVREGDTEKARRVAGQQVCRICLCACGKERVLHSPVLARAVQDMGESP